jgi:hypothetical protein
LTDHLGALVDQQERSMSETYRGPFPDWENALATIESLTDIRLVTEWFHRPQLVTNIRAARPS